MRDILFESFDGWEMWGGGEEAWYAVCKLLLRILG